MVHGSNHESYVKATKHISSIELSARIFSRTMTIARHFSNLTFILRVINSDKRVHFKILKESTIVQLLEKKFDNNWKATANKFKI